MSTPAVTFDLSTAKPLAADPVAPVVAPQAQALQGAVAFASQQKPDHYAKLLKFQQLTGVPPVVSNGNEAQVQQAADANSFDPHTLTAIAPQTSRWASDQDNAAVSGVEEIHRNAGIEQNAAMMRAYTPTAWQDFKDKAAQAYHLATGQTLDDTKQRLYEYPLTRFGINVAAGTAGMAGNVASFFGLHGDGPTKQNILQRVETNLSPEANTDPAAAFHKSTEFDWISKNVAPMIPAILASGGSSLLASTMGVSETAAKVLAGLTVGGAFTADQAGKTFTSVSAAGGSDYAARLAANRVAAINAVPNALFGATDVVPLLRNNPLATSLGIGGLTGASGQVSQNVVTGKPAGEGILGAAVQGAAMQGGLHLGTDLFFGNLNQAVDATAESKLRERSPEKFQEAMQAVFEGDASLRIPADKFADYFKAQGINPQEAASSIGSTNYAEAVMSGGDVEVPKDAYFANLDPEHQKGLLPDVVDPSTGLTQRQHQEGRDELQQWVTGGGPDKMVADAADADAETSSSPEFQAVKADLQQRYVDAGESPEVAETLAEKDANVYSNIAKSAGLKPSELVAMYNPKVAVGEAPEGSLAQGGTEGGTNESPRGWFKVNPDGSYEIGRTKIGDLSTFSHESSHAYLHVLSDLAAREGASETLKNDHAKILEYLGAKPGEELTTEQQETWARANEQYLREGKAPSSKLRGTFQRFGVWLQSVYKKASDLGVTLSDDIRGVLDRLYASETGVDKAAAEAGPKLFTTPEEAGWTEEQFQSYADAHDVSVEQAKAHILSKLNEANLRESTSAWREEESNVRSAVTTEIDQKPEYVAIRALRKGKMEDDTSIALSKDELVKQFGEQRVKDLQKLHPGMYRTEGEGSPETTAEMLGFESAEQMMKALESAPRRSVAIEDATRTYMTSKHGDIRYDGTLQDQARLAVENDKRADGLHKELNALRRQVEKLKTDDSNRKIAARSVAVAPIEAYHETARLAMEEKAPADIQPIRYLDASRKYSREAFDAMRKGDPWEAAQAKHKELLNHFLFREASKAQEFIGKFESYAKRMQTKGVQEKLGKAGGDYRDQFNGILARYQLGPYMGQPERTLSDWTQAQYADGKEPAIDPAILNEARTLNYKNAPLSEIRMVQDALVNVRKLASLELGIEVNGRKIEFEQALTNLNTRARDSLKSNPRPVFEDNRTAAMKAGDLVNRGSALLTRTEFLMERLDGGKQGPWHDYLWHLASDAQGNESRLQTEVTKRVGDALQNIPKEQRVKLLDKVSIEGIDEPITRRSMIAMAFNMGNEGNLDRLEKTFESHGWDPGAIDKVRNSLTREEWKFVQDGWESLKPLGVAQSELERRMTGLPPVMVKPVPFEVELADGSKLELDGGYYPVVMDPRFSTRGALQDASTTAQNIMEAGYGRATTSRGNMKERTGYGGPLQLDYEQVLTQHTAKVIKDITHREFMLAANKVLSDQSIRNTLTDTLGPGNEAQMMPWLRTIVNDRNGSTVQGLGDLSRAMNALRTNVVKAALGFKFSTVLLQITHASSVFLHTSPLSYAQAMIDFVAHPLDMTEQIKNLSPNEMSSRGDNIDRDMRKVLQDEKGKTGFGDLWVKAGMAPVQFMDHMLSFPLWLSVYRDALAENTHLTETEASYQAMHKADGAVRTGLGSNAPKDLPPIMRQNDFTKLLTTMGGFHNLKYNQIQGVANKFKSDRRYGSLTYGAVMAALIPAVMGPLITGRGPKDDDNVAGWAAKKALLFPAETIAILNIAVEAMENGGDVRFSPIAGTVERAAKAGIHATADKPDKDWTGIGMDALQSTMEAFGVSGTDQAFKTGRYVRKASNGEVENPNVIDAITGEPRKAR